MYQLELATSFSAAHALVIQGVREPLHGHDWHVTVFIEGNSLDHDGLLVDFHPIHHDLAEIIKPWHNRCLNDVGPFDQVNPSAEHVAREIAERLSARLKSREAERPNTHTPLAGAPNQGADPGSGVPRVRVARVRVTEAVGCAAAYTPPPPPAPTSP